MALIPTKQLFDEYYESASENAQKKSRPQVDRPEVYAFEIEIGKQLIDMNSDELIQMISTFKNNRRTDKDQNEYKMSPRTYTQITCYYRDIFDYYSRKYTPINNPFHLKEMRGVSAASKVSKKSDPITIEYVEDIIKKLYSEFDVYKAKYIECIIRLFLEGFANASEIANLKEEDINFETREVSLPRRRIVLSEHTIELLKYVRTIPEFYGNRATYPMVAWHGGYFKYNVSRKSESIFDSYPLEYVTVMINKRITVDVNRTFGCDLNYGKLYYLGAYLYLEKKCGGREKAAQIILSPRNDESSKMMNELIEEYHLLAKRPAEVKSLLVPYV